MVNFNFFDVVFNQFCSDDSDFNDKFRSKISIKIWFHHNLLQNFSPSWFRRLSLLHPLLSLFSSIFPSLYSLYLFHSFFSTFLLKRSVWQPAGCFVLLSKSSFTCYCCWQKNHYSTQLCLSGCLSEYPCLISTLVIVLFGNLL